MTLFQRTINQEVTFTGKGLFSGKMATVRLLPANPGSGIAFRRTDMADSPLFLGTTAHVQDAARCTKIGMGSASVQTIEHFMAAVWASEIDNLMVEISGPEMPIFDGSAKPFLEILHAAGSIEQSTPKEIYNLDRPLFWSKGEMSLVALPAEEFKISYTLHYPQSPYLKSQYFSYTVSSHTFGTEIAPCRTFALYEEIAPLIEKGALLDAGLESGVVIDGMKVLNPEGLRFADEMVRHKILDMIGDLALLGVRFKAHLIAIKTGHAANHQMAKEMQKYLRRQ